MDQNQAVVAAVSEPRLIDNRIDHYYPQVWLLVMSVVAFGFYVAWDQQLLQAAFAVDRSYLVQVILIVFLISSGHALWFVVCFSSRIHLAHRVLRGGVGISDLREFHQREMKRHPSIMSLSPVHYLGNFFEEVEKATPKAASPGDSDELTIVEIYADGLRSAVELGWYIVDMSIRLGLIGTIVGFILIFSSLSGSAVPEIDQLQDLLIAMSGGMGTALYTTLFGLVCASILGFQYMILNREVEHLVGLLIRLRNLNLYQLGTER